MIIMFIVMRPIQLELENTHSLAHITSVMSNRSTINNEPKECVSSRFKNILLLLERVNF